VHDKQVRRRRAVLALLVCASLILLTAYFGNSSSSPLHSAQRAIAEVLSPIQNGASKVLSPVRDVAGWVSDTFHAKSEVGQLRRENSQLKTDLAQALYAETQVKRLSALVKLDQTPGFDVTDYSPVGADVIGYDPSLWYQQIEVDKGYDDGVHSGDPVIGNDGLVGDVSFVAATVSYVTELTDDKFGAGAEIVPGGYSGVLQPQAGNSGLLLTYVPTNATGIRPGDEVVTSGFVDPHDPAVRSHFPAGIPIGQVSSSYTPSDLINEQEVPVTPNVNLRNLSVVQILTHPNPAGTERASLAAP